MIKFFAKKTTYDIIEKMIQGDIMKNTKKVLAMALLLSLPANGLGLMGNQNKAISFAASELDFGIKTDKFETNSLTFKLKQDEANKLAALKARNKIRSEMWDRNVPYTYDETSNKNNTKLRDYLKSVGINSKTEYLNQTKWSTDLEKIAIQRIYEVSITGLSHLRPDGSDCYTAALPDGTRTYAEILANNTDPFTPEKAFNQWAYSPRKNYGNKSEYDLLLESNGVYNNGNAHLHLILDPEYDHMALSIISTPEINYVGVEFGYASNSGNKALGLVGDYTMNFGKKDLSKDTNKENDKINREDAIERLKKAIDANKTQVAAAKYLLENAPTTVAKVKDKLLTQIKNAEAIIEKSEKILERL